MTTPFNRPFLVIPKLIVQPTWGGDYLVNLKHWGEKNFLAGKKIGQSYELFGQSKLAVNITSTEDEKFIPEIGFPDKPEIVEDLFNLNKNEDYINLEELVKQKPTEILGEKVVERFNKMPLLIKLNHAAGNSFQLHAKAKTIHPRWQSKPESWYYLEDGLVTFGIKKGIEIDNYQKICLEIDDFMKSLSQQIKDRKITVEEAKEKANLFIKEKNPWQFVNKHAVKKYDMLDLSMGGLHHSWEEDKEKFPQGNILLEVQQDVMDPVCTIRAFDQGKIKSDGTIRPLNINDYFEFIDTDPENNNIKNALKKREGRKLLSTPYYSLDILEIDNVLKEKTKDSFEHLYIRDGKIEVATSQKSIKISRGHSCFIPWEVHEYEIRSLVPNSVVLKTFIE